jgi:S-adenosylmethionine decarboxylase proenzyme
MPSSPPAQTAGTHLLIEYHGCDPRVLNDPARVQAMMEAAVEATGATIVRAVFHTYAPQGVTGVVVVEESHFSIHTWPEHAYAAVDVFTCGDCDAMAAHPVLLEGTGAAGSEWMRIRRGAGPVGRSISVDHHAVEGDLDSD